MLKNIRIKNFKALRSVEVKDLKKINILIGLNNSGKSSILHALAFIAQSVKKHPDYAGSFIDLNSFESIAFKKDVSNAIEVALTFKLSQQEQERIGKVVKGTPYENFDFSTVEYLVKAQGDRFLLESCFLSDGKKLFEVRKDDARIRYAYLSREYAWDGTGMLLDWKAQRVEEAPYCGDLANTIKEILLGNLGRIFYISPYRGVWNWSTEIPKEDEPDFVGSKAEKSILKLHYIYCNRPDLFDRIEKWAKRFGTGAVISGLKKGETYMGFVDPALEVEVNAASSGFGLSQAMPIIIQCFAPPADSVIMIEEPEIHLHPHSQYEMMDMFVETVSEGKQIVMTTYSWPFLVRLLKLVYEEGRLDEEHDVALYEVVKTKEGTRVYARPLGTAFNKLKRELQGLLQK